MKRQLTNHVTFIPSRPNLWVLERGENLAASVQLVGIRIFDHRTDHHNHHNHHNHHFRLHFFIILGHLFVSFVGNQVILVAKTVQEGPSGQFGKKQSIIHQSSFSADKPIHCHNCPVLLTLFILVNHLKFCARVDIANRVVDNIATC